MAQRIESTYICDACKADIPEGAKRFVLHGVQYDFDLCMECHNTMRFNSGAAARNPSLHSCKDCAFMAKSASGLTLHRNKKHRHDPRA